MNFVIFFNFFFTVQGFNFFIAPGQTICFREDLLSETLAVVEVNSQDEFGLRIQDSGNYFLYEKTHNTHKYSWTAFNSGVYSCCVFATQAQETRVEFSLKKGVRAKDYSHIAKTNNLKGIEVSLKKLGELGKDVHKKIKYLREREEQLRNTNDTIHNRVIVYSISTICILLALGITQIMYLKRFFKSKKMI